MKNIDKTKNYFIEEINENELMSNKHKEVTRIFNHIELLFILIPTVTGCVSIPAFVSFVSIPIEITSVQWD